MEFPNGSGQDIDMMYPLDMEYWTKLKEFVDYEPVSAITRNCAASWTRSAL